MWFVIVLFVISLIASLAMAALMRPKGPPPPKPATLDEVQVSVAEEGKEIPVIFGTVDLQGQNVVWYGSFMSTAIRRSA